MYKRLLLCLLLVSQYLVTAAAGLLPDSSAVGSDITFTPNRHQWASWIRYQADLTQGAIYVEDTAMTFLLLRTDHYRHQHSHIPDSTRGHIMRITFEGANPQPVIQPSYPKSYYRNYYHGSDPAHWASQVPVYSMVTYRDLYTGIDADLMQRGNDFEYQFRIAPTVAPSIISLRYEGVDHLKISKSGDLQMEVSTGEVKELKPYAYQKSGEIYIPIPCQYVLDKKHNRVFFHLDNYDTSKELVIDPTLVFSSATGSTADNWGFTATYDHAGNFYAGSIVFQYGIAWYPTTGVGAYPTVGAVQNVFQGDTQDIAISKFNPTGSNLIYSTYLGGDSSEWPHSLVVNQNDELYVFGSTTSLNFPVSTSAYQKTIKGGMDLLVTRFSVSGAALLGSTYIGGSGKDGQNGDAILEYNYGDNVRGEINVDSIGNIYIASCTYSNNFPTTGGAFKTTTGGGLEGCVLKIDPTLSTLMWSSYLGGSGQDAAYSVKLDHQNNLIVTGPTTSINFPTTTGVYHTTYQGGDCDGYVCKISNNGATIIASSYIGTSGHDQCFFSEVDGHNSIYLIGQTLGSYPITSGSYSNTGGNQFIEILDSNLHSSLHSTAFGTGGGKVNISPTAFLVDRCYNIYVAGWGGDVNQDLNPLTGFTTGMPTTAGAYQTTTDGSDLYFIVFKPNLTGLLYGTFFGGNQKLVSGFNPGEHVDGGTCRFDKDGIMYSAVCSDCGGHNLFPRTAGAWSTTNNSQNCNYTALKFDMNLAGTSVKVTAAPRYTGCVPLTVNFTSQFKNVTTYKWFFGDGDSTTTQINPIHTYIDTGLFNVMLIGDNPFTCNEHDTSITQIWVRRDSIVANFSSTLQTICELKTITATAVAYPTTHYRWDYGDGKTDTTFQTTTHTYITPGKYTMKLVIIDTNHCNLIDSFSTIVSIQSKLHAQLSVPDSGGCIPLTVHFANVSDSTPTLQYLWDFGDGSATDTARSPTHIYTVGGDYIATVWMRDTANCNFRDSVHIHIHAIDSFVHAAFFGNTTFVFCDSAFVIVRSLNKGETWQHWDFGDGFTSTADTIFHAYQGHRIDTITHIVYDSRMVCHPYDTARIAVSLNPLKTGITIADTAGCLPFTAHFTGTSPLFTTHYYWFFGDGDSTHGEKVTHTYSHTDTFHVTCISIDSNACVNRDSNFATIIVIDDSVHALFTLQTLNDCDSDLFIALTNNSIHATTYRWDFGDGHSSTLPALQYHYHQPGTYTIQLYAEDTTRCHPRDSMRITVRLKPNVKVDFSLMDICQKNVEQFVNNSNPKAAFVWYFGDDSSSVHFSPAHYYLKDGLYQVMLTITDTSTCDVYDTIVKPIRIYPQPVASFVMDSDTVNFEHPFVFTNTSQHSDGAYWTFGDSTSSTVYSPTHIYDHTIGWQRVCLAASMTGAPCQDSICDSVYVHFIRLIGVPNAFSPNGDGINDFARVEGRGIVALRFRIFNRWGQLLYESTDQKQGWDGTYNGTPQDMDVYTYTVDATMINREPVQLKGNITLLR